MKSRMKFSQTRLLTLMGLVAAVALGLRWGGPFFSSDPEILWRGERLRSDRPGERLIALEELEAFVSTAGQAETLRPMLLKLTLDEAPAVRARGLSLLTTLTRASLLRAEAIAEDNQVIARALSDPDSRVRRAAVLCFAESIDLPVSATDPLKQLITDLDPDVRAAAYRGLIGSQLRWEERCATVCEALRDASPVVRKGVLDIVGVNHARMNPLLTVDESTALTIVASMGLDWSEVAQAAAAALARLKSLPQSAEDGLLRALDSPNLEVVIQAAVALRQLGSISAPTRVLLAKRAGSHDGRLGQEAAKTLVIHTRSRAGLAALFWQAHLEYQIPNNSKLWEHSDAPSLDWTSGWVLALIQYAPESPEARKALAGLVANLNSGGPLVPSALLSLRQCAPHAEMALPALRTLASHPDESIRRAAIDTIQAIETALKEAARY